MEDSYENIRRLMLAINKIDGSYYFLPESSGSKKIHWLFYMHWMTENLIHRNRYVKIG